MAFSRIITSVLVMIYFIVWLHYLMRKGSRGYKHELNRFLERERRANAARKKEINPDYFITPDIGALPIVDYTDDPADKILKRRQAAVIKKGGLTMLKLPEHKTNTELKFEFGIANLDKIIMYEENFQEYIRTLNDWAEALLMREAYEDAEIVLAEAVSLGSELSKSYMLLGDIYAKNSDKQKLTALYNRLEQTDCLSRHTQLKNKVLQYLEDMLN